jgi:acyl-coenzyme A synthetase/AMP-(fatty) acid ligase
LNRGQNVKYRPWAFTEHGAIMAASVLNSPRAVEMSVFVVRAFVRLRTLARGHAELAATLRQLERRVAGHDHELAEIIEAIRRLTSPPGAPRRAIGFTRGGSS